MITLPNITVRINGTPLSKTDAESLGRVRVQQRLSLPTQCELTFFEILAEGGHDTTPFNPGDAVEIAVDDLPTLLFSGQITAIEYKYEPSGRQVLHIRAYDLLHQLRKRQPVRAHVELTTSELASKLVSDLGVTVQAVEKGPLQRRIIQHCQTDFELLQELADQCGLYFTLRDKTLYLITLEGMGDTETLTLNKNLLEARIEINSDPACRSVTVDGWDTLSNKKHSGQTKRARATELPNEAAPDKVGGSGKHFLTNAIVENDTQAKALAQARLDAYAAREKTFWGVAEGAPHLQPGSRIKIEGLQNGDNATHVLTSVNHLIDGHKGYLCELSTLPPAPQTRPTVSSCMITLGIVTRIQKQPGNIGRIRASLPSYNNIETGWMNTLFPGAGSKKGLIMLPDIGDHVAVIFARGDLGQGIVIGSFYDTQIANVPEPGIENNGVKRFTFLSSSGHKITLDDAQGALHIDAKGDLNIDAKGTFNIDAEGPLNIDSKGDTNIKTAGNAQIKTQGNTAIESDGDVSIKNGKGSSLSLLSGTAKLHSATSLEIEAPGKSITIRGSKIDFKKG